LSTDELAPAEVISEAEQRRESRILLATAALGQIVKESIVTDVFQSIAQLPGGV
jgi:hypothetical protein